MSIKMAKEAQQLSIPLPPPLPPTKMGIVKQGIVSILGTDTEKRNKGVAGSIRRTLSADMSSKKWLSQNGFSPMKKIASSKELDVLGQDEIWRSIQNGGNKTSNDVWSSILNQKNEESSTLPPPYIHPLLKKSSSSLTDKSLEICTESLGSETGSEIISLDHHHHLQEQQQVKEELSPQTFEEFPVVKFHHSKKSSSPLLPKSFPPTISSLAAEDNKPSVHMQSHRQNGRLILEAVSVPPQNHFRVERVDGRLLLTLITTSSEIETEDINVHQDELQELEHNEPDRDDGKGNDTKGMQIVLEQKSRLSNGRMNVNTSTLMMKQLMGVSLEKKNKKYPNMIHNNAIKLIEDEDVIAPIIPQSLSTHLITPEASPFNAYNYFWKKNPIAKSTTKIAEQQDLVLMRENKGNINYLVPMLKGCKEQRKSLLIWEPYCIATS